MSELELLFLILVAIYAWECACWVPRGSVAFLTWSGRRWQPVHPGTLLGNLRGGLVFAFPLPPLGTVLAGTQFPLSVSAEAVLAYVAPAVNPGGRPVQSAKLCRFDEFRAVAVKAKNVIVNDEVLVRAASPLLAAHLAEKLRLLGKTPAPARAKAIENLMREGFDTTAIERRWRAFQNQSARVRLLTNFLFLYLFLLAPLAIWLFGLRLAWPALLVGLLACTVATATSFRRCHKAFFPDAEDERFTHFLTILLSPATTIRAHDVLSRPLLEMFHPLAIAKVFCADDTFRQFAERVLRDIRHPALPVCPGPEPGAQAVERYARRLLQTAAEEFLERNGINPGELAQPPMPADATCHSYCPRCLAQFTTTAGVCEDCGGLTLVAFASNGSVSQRRV